MTEKLQGVATYLRGPDGHSTVLLPYIVEPNEPKRLEWMGPYQWLLQPHQYEMISGKVEVDDNTIRQAIEREAWEERRVVLNGNTKLLNHEVQVGQERNGISVSFLVHLFLTQLSEDQIADLAMQQPVTVVGDEAMPDFLNMSDRIDFRPSIYGLVCETLQHNFWTD